jgi:hypothetical protein
LVPMSAATLLVSPPPTATPSRPTPPFRDAESGRGGPRPAPASGTRPVPLHTPVARRPPGGRPPAGTRPPARALPGGRARSTRRRASARRARPTARPLHVAARARPNV